MKNCRRSDHELADVLGISQPTVGRLIKKLEEQGLIKEYTAIPDFHQLGYNIASLTLVKLKKGLSPEEIEKARQTSLTDMRKAPDQIILFERGMAGDFTGVIVSFHKDFTDYLKLKEMMREYPFVDASATLSFLIDLSDKIHYRYLTFSTLAKHLLTMHKQDKK